MISTLTGQPYIDPATCTDHEWPGRRKNPNFEGPDTKFQEINYPRTGLPACPLVDPSNPLSNQDDPTIIAAKRTGEKIRALVRHAFNYELKNQIDRDGKHAATFPTSKGVDYNSAYKAGKVQGPRRGDLISDRAFAYVYDSLEDSNSHFFSRGELRANHEKNRTKPDQKEPVSLFQGLNARNMPQIGQGFGSIRLLLYLPAVISLGK